MKQIKTGVVGTGHLGRFHALNYKKIPTAHLVGVYDSNPQKAAKVAQETKCKAYPTLDSLLEEVDAVSLAVPTDLHHAIGVKILNKGIHCLIEKPIATNCQEADELIDYAQKKNLILHVGHIEKFNPALRSLADFNIQPQFIESHRLALFNPRGTEVSVVLDLMIHDLEIILDLIKSPIKSIDASGVAVVSDTIDIANTRIRFTNKAVANLTASRISQKNMRKMRMFQKDAYITVDFLNRISEIFHLNEEGNKLGKIVGTIGAGSQKKNIYYYKPKIPKEMGLEVELKNFLAHIDGKQTTAVTGGQARKALAVAHEIIDQIT
ncbi:MAG: Gfo/Idh/MocA family oxidoreductase [bacterium]